MGAWYCTREDVKAALDAGDTIRSNAQIDRLIEGCSRSIESLTHRRFYPELATRSWPWPDRQLGTSWRLWLDGNEIISVTTLTSGSTAIIDYFLEPQRYGPPYSSIDLDLSGTGSYGGGETFQRDVTVTGLFGYSDDSVAAGALAEALDATETAVDVTDSAAVGIGSILKVGTERMIVTGKTLATTGQTGTLTAAKSATALAVTDGSTFVIGESLLLDSERVRVLDIAGNTLVVERATDGTVLAAHTAATIFAARTLTVTRGALGSTATTHLTAAAVSVHLVPGPVRDLCVAEVLVRLAREQSGYARTVGTGEGQRNASGGDLADLRKAVVRSHGRRMRTRVV